MKKLASLLLSAAMLLGLAACGGTSSSVTASSEGRFRSCIQQRRQL